VNAQPTLFDAISDLELQAMRFHRDNPQVYRAFRERALALIAQGQHHGSGKFLTEQIRYDPRITTSGIPVKVNNSHTAYFVRMFVDEYPQHRGFFELRRVKNGTVNP
jgi:hypothetical protein